LEFAKPDLQSVFKKSGSGLQGFAEGLRGVRPIYNLFRDIEPGLHSRAK